MKAYNKEKMLFGVLTFDDLGMTQDQMCQIFTVYAIIIT